MIDLHKPGFEIAVHHDVVAQQFKAAGTILVRWAGPGLDAPAPFEFASFQSNKDFARIPHGPLKLHEGSWRMMKVKQTSCSTPTWIVIDTSSGNQ